MPAAGAHAGSKPEISMHQVKHEFTDREAPWFTQHVLEHMYKLECTRAPVLTIR